MPVVVNPFAGWRVSQGWTDGSHRNNPAIDYPMPVGTRLRSPAAGRIRLQHWNGSRSGGNPGNKVIVDLPDGRSIHLAHLSRFDVAHGQYVAQLQDLGLSGNTGDVRPAPTRANPNSGAHLHTFGLLMNGARWNWILDAAAPASGGSVPFEPKEWDEMASPEDFRAIIRDELNKRGGDATQAVQDIRFIASQVGGVTPVGPDGKPDRDLEPLLSTAISRVTEILFAVDGQADPRIIGADGKPFVRGIAAFLRNPNVNATIDPTPILNAIREAVAEIPGVDPAVVERAAEAGARAAVAGLTLKAQ